MSYAREDLGWARASAEASYFSRACFVAQQAAEKALKGCLVSKTGVYPRIHALIELLESASKLNPTLMTLKSNCDVLDEYYLPARYPIVRYADDFESRDSSRAMAFALQIVDMVDNLIREAS